MSNGLKFCCGWKGDFCYMYIVNFPYEKKNPEKIYYIWSTFYQGKVATPTPLFCVQKKNM